MPKLLVTGATGLQGGSVIRAFLGHPSVSLRALTRDPASPAAVVLAKQGVEVVPGDLNDSASVEKAMLGVDAAFLVTAPDFANPDPAGETAQGTKFIDIAKANGVKKLVFSGLENATKDAGIVVPHFDAKGDIEEYLKTSGIPFTVARLSFYYSNFLTYFRPRKMEDGSYVIALPMGTKDLAACDVEETGLVVRTILHNFDEFSGKTVQVSGELSPMSRYADIISKVTGKTVKYQEVPLKVFGSFGFPGAHELEAMFEYYQSGKFLRNPEETRAMLPGAGKTFEEWVMANKDKLF